ncbi:type II toxin-antitoxin system RelE/ParE family toxin [Thiopseudomonas denitrificans]|uniref:type II toxin-antitoxin system RelE/ParE family toxin n=1 Tax=Thiopseudomonas denitrificans TaxID=1501432 RepID=UPI000C76FBBC|nr:killer suppression protein HigA [Thiopseudomonas denitrificans]NLD13744.1 killer suppression protein HigA [Gammaproteobacteria bacterium]
MEILYASKKWQQLCESRKEAEKKLGTDCARKLRARLADLEAARRVGDLAAGNPHPLKGDRSGQFALNLAGGYRLVFSAANDPAPLQQDGSIHWYAVTIVCIEFIGDYHG